MKKIIFAMLAMLTSTCAVEEYKDFNQTPPSSPAHNNENVLPRPNFNNVCTPPYEKTCPGAPLRHGRGQNGGNGPARRFLVF